MPERIETATMAGVEADTLEVDDDYPGTYGFLVRLSRDPGQEWAYEFEAVYESAAYPGKPPIVYLGDALRIYYLPRYAADLPRFLRFLEGVITQANRSVEKRNSVLPETQTEREAFRRSLRDAISEWQRDRK